MKKFNKIKDAYVKAANKATNDFKTLVKKNSKSVKENNQTLTAVEKRIAQENALLYSETEFANKMLKDIEG